MTDTNKAAEANGDARAETISLFDVLAEEAEQSASATLKTLRIGADAIFVSFFTDTVVPVSAHFLEATDSWNRTYARCLGETCPACKAGLKRTDYLLLPVFDRVEGVVSILRMSREKGPGRLITELGRVLNVPDRERLIVKIARNRNFVHTLTVETETELDPEFLQAVKGFREGVDGGAINSTSVIPDFSSEELCTHEAIAKRLTLAGAS